METWGWVIIGFLGTFCVCVICATIARVQELKTGFGRAAGDAKKNPGDAAGAEDEAGEGQEESSRTQEDIDDIVAGLMNETNKTHD